MVINKSERISNKKGIRLFQHKLLLFMLLLVVILITGIWFLQSLGYTPERIISKILRESVQVFDEIKNDLKYSMLPSQQVPTINQAASFEKILFKQTTINGPLKVSTLNPRYFTDSSGRAILLTGSHYWLNFQDGIRPDPPPTFNYTAWLDFLENNNHNFFRLWVWEQARWTVESSDDYFFTPLPYVRSGPGSALDGKPKFDLSHFNQAYFDRIRARVIEAGQRNMYVSIMLFDGWSIESAKGQYALNNPWLGHPFNKNNNINSINGDPDQNNSGEEIHQDVVPEITALQKEYVRKVVDTVNDLDNVLFEIANESNTDSIQWQYDMINYIKDYEKTLPKQHPVGMTVTWPGGMNNDVYGSPADWISINNQDGTYMDSPPATDGNKVSIYDTDHLCGICGDRYWAWKSFTRGHNPIFMDQYDDSYKLNGGGYDINNPNDVSLRENLGYIRDYSNRMNLNAMKPLSGLASSGFILANPDGNQSEYLVYLPSGGSVIVDLSGASGSLQVEWLNPSNGLVTAGGSTTGGGNRTFTAPFSGDAALYLYPASTTVLESKTFIPKVAKKNLIPAPGFVETFDGLPTSPTAWNSLNWDVQVHSRNDDTWLTLEAMQAGHGAACDPPPTTHFHEGSYPDSVFLCRDHVMTAINASGYGEIILTPNQMVDFSRQEAVVQFDMSTLRTSSRDWIDLWITPFNDNLALPIDFNVDLQGNPKNGVHIRMTFGDNGTFTGSVFRNFTGTALPIATQTPYDQALTPSAKERSTFELRISRTHIRFGLPKYNLWWIDSNVTDLGWDRAVIQLGHHSYTPTKDCDYSSLACEPNTWHWDNVRINPAIPFTIIKADKRYIKNGDASQAITFSTPAPANAYLRFSGIGKIDVSFDGGPYQAAVKAQSSELPGIGEYHPEHLSSYWTPIPQGSKSVKFRFSADSWYTTGYPMIAKDFAIWSQGEK